MASFASATGMIRAKYSFNPKTTLGLTVSASPIFLITTRTIAPGLMPFEQKWTIDWSQFFGNGAMNTNLSVMIGPWSRIELENAVRGPDPSEPGLTVRDLTSSIAIAAVVGSGLGSSAGRESREPPGAIALSGGRSGRPAKSALAQKGSRLAARSKQPCGGLNDKDIAILATDPPIPFVRSL